MSNPRAGYRYQSLFWPALLILIGVFALLFNTGLIPADRLYRLVDLWPLILVVIGLELLVRRAALPASTSVVAAALIIVLAVAGAGAYVAVGPALPGGSRSLDSSQPLGDLSQATVEIDVGGATIAIRGDSSLGDALYSTHIDYSGRTPEVSLDRSGGVLRISQNGGSFGLFQNQRFAIDLRINTGIPWRVSINAGGTTSKLDLSHTRVSGISINAGGSTEDITLGPPSGIVPISINGGGVTAHIHRPGGSAASVRVSGAGISLTFDGRHHVGLGTVEDSSGPADDSYLVQVSGGGCTVTMDTAA